MFVLGVRTNAFSAVDCIMSRAIVFSTSWRFSSGPIFALRDILAAICIPFCLPRILSAGRGSAWSRASPVPSSDGFRACRDDRPHRGGKCASRALPDISPDALPARAAFRAARRALTVIAATVRFMRVIRAISYYNQAPDCRGAHDASELPPRNLKTVLLVRMSACDRGGCHDPISDA